MYLLDNADAEALVFHSSLGDRVERIRERLPKLKLLIEVDDGGAGQVPVARRYEEVIASHEPMPRITRDERRHLHALHRRHHRHAQGRDVRHGRPHPRRSPRLGFPLLGLAPPTDAAEIAPLVKGVIDAGGRAHLACRARR